MGISWIVTISVLLWTALSLVIYRLLPVAIPAILGTALETGPDDSPGLTTTIRVVMSATLSPLILLAATILGIGIVLTVASLALGLVVLLVIAVIWIFFGLVVSFLFTDEVKKAAVAASVPTN
jgi:hypothetical protein